MAENKRTDIQTGKLFTGQTSQTSPCNFALLLPPLHTTLPTLEIDKISALQNCPTQEVARKRKQYVGYNTTLLYSEPLHIVEGKGCKLYDAEGREYLDCANNVAHVGHSHPKVRIAIWSWYSEHLKRNNHEFRCLQI